MSKAFVPLTRALGTRAVRSVRHFKNAACRRLLNREAHDILVGLTIGVYGPEKAQRLFEEARRRHTHEVDVWCGTDVRTLRAVRHEPWLFLDEA